MSDVKTLLEALKDLSKEDIEKALSVLENKEEQKDDIEYVVSDDIEYVLSDARRHLRDLEIARELIADTVHVINDLLEEIEITLGIESDEKSETTEEEIEESDFNKSVDRREDGLPLSERPSERGIGDKPKNEVQLIWEKIYSLEKQIHDLKSKVIQCTM